MLGACCATWEKSSHNGEEEEEGAYHILANMVIDAGPDGRTLSK